MSSRGQRLKQALRARGVVKQLALAQELGVNESAVSRWQQEGGLTLANAAQLCQILDISMDWLILNRGDMDFHREDSQHPLRDEIIKIIDGLPENVSKSMVALMRALNDETPR